MRQDASRRRGLVTVAPLPSRPSATTSSSWGRSAAGGY